MNTKENQKYKATHLDITNALLEALKEKDIKKVSVTEICRSVGINRSTFYEHFLDVYDVLEQMAVSISNEALQNAPQGPPTRENFLFLLRHIKKHKAFYRLYFAQGIPVNIQEKIFFNKIPPVSQDVLDVRGIHSTLELEYHHAFFHAGLQAILKKWTERSCKESPEKIYDILRKEYRQEIFT